MKIPIQSMLLLLVFGIGKTAYSQDILWEKSLGGKQADYLMDAQPTADYGFILAGSSLSKKTGSKTDDNVGDLDYWIWKMDEKGELVWQKNFGGEGSDFLQSIFLTNDGGFILGGNSSSNKGFSKNDDSKGLDDFWIIKLNAKGDEEWQKTIGGSGQEKMQIIKQTKDGGYIIGGSSDSYKSEDKSEDCFGSLDYWIVKLDNKGKIEWQKTIGGKYLDELRSLDITFDGGYILGGYSNSPISYCKKEDNKGFGDYWIVKLDNKGTIEWQKTIGGNQDDQLYVIHQTKDNGYIVGGNSNSSSSDDKKKSNQNGTDFWVFKMSEIGEITWQETYDFGKVDILTSIVENDDNTFLLGGFAQSEVMGTKKQDKESINDYVILKINPKGEEIWKKSVGSAGEDILKKAIQTRDGGYLLTGTSSGKISRDKNSKIGGNDFWVVKLKDNNKPKIIKVPIEAFPNPTDKFTNVIINHEYNTGTATLYDISGRQLQNFSITENTVPIDLGNLPIGIYIVEIKTNKEKGSVKIIKK